MVTQEKLHRTIFILCIQSLIFHFGFCNNWVRAYERVFLWKMDSIIKSELLEALIKSLHWRLTASVVAPYYLMSLLPPEILPHNTGNTF